VYKNEKFQSIFGMGSWFSSSSEASEITVNTVNSPVQMTPANSTLNLSLEEMIKETAIVILIVFLWEIVKNKISQKAEKLAQAAANV
jgi:hypothetical protein